MPMWKSVDSVERAGRENAPRGPEELCFSEDRFGGFGAMAWILDGASSVSAQRVTTARSDATWIVEQLEDELLALADRPEPLQVLVAEALEHTAQRAHDEWTAVPAAPPSAALGIVRRVGDRTDFLVLADVSIIVRTEAGVLWLIDRRVDVHNEPARIAMAKYLSSGMGFDEAKAKTDPHLAAPRQQAMNKDGGYWVASNDPAAARHALTGSLDHVDEVILATDGFMRAVDLFGLVRHEDLFDADFGELGRQIRRAEQDDPETERFPRWSRSDDMCAHKLRWVE
jgi:hypothetical protein